MSRRLQLLSRQYAFWIGAMLLLALLFESQFLGSVESLLFDTRAYLTTGGELDPRIVVAGIDEGAMSGNPHFHVKGLGRWPWPRTVWAAFLRRARQCGVKLVVFDVFFLDKVPGDDAFAREIAKGPPVILADKLQGSPYGEEAETLLPPIPPFKEGAVGTGFVNIGFVHKSIHGVPLVDEVQTGAPYVPSLDLETVRYLSGNPPFEVQANKVSLGDRSWPTVGDDHELMLRWANPHTSLLSGFVDEKGIGQQNYISVLDMFINSGSPQWRASMKGKILLVGAADSSLQDESQTPVNTRYGVIIHANTINALLHDQYYRTAGTGWNMVIFFVPALLLAFVLRKSSAHRGVILAGIFIGAFVLINVLVFDLGWYLHMAGPCLSMALVYVGGTIHHRLEAERKRSEISQIYGRYLAPQVRKELMDGYEAQRAELSGALREVTVMESDIRGFTTLSENLPAEEVVRLLNVYFTAMIPILYKHGGTWDKFVGDALLAYFGAPVHQDDHPDRAVACAVDMIREIDRLRKEGIIPFEVGFGIHTGPVKVGHIGADATKDSEEQKQFTIIGDTVNLAARLCGKAEGGTLILSESTYRELRRSVDAAPLGPISVKGKAQEVNVYQISPMKEVASGAAAG